MKLFAWLALILLFSPCMAPAQTQDASPSDAPDKQTDYTKIVGHFFDALKAAKYTAAAHVLIDTNPQDEFNVDKHESLAVPLQKIAETFGEFKLFEPIVNKTLGDGIGYVYGLAIYARNPIRFEFMFYKDTDGHWRLLHIDFNLNYVPEIRDIAGVHVPQPVAIPGPAPTVPSTPPPSTSKPATPDTSTPSSIPTTTNSAPTPSTPLATPPSTSPPPAPSSPPATPPASSPAPAPGSPSPTSPPPAP